MQTGASPSGLPFMKMHGLGNDFVVIDSRGRAAQTTPALARAVGDRHRGVGFDQLAEIRDGEGSDIWLDFWNSDGSRAGACGNATRCVAAHVMGETGRDHLSIRTTRGLLEAQKEGEAVWVNMGEPQLDWDQVPMAEAVENPQAFALPGLPGDAGLPPLASAVGMGNPHCVFFVGNIDRIDVAGIGPQVEKHAMFPEYTNVEFAEIRAEDEIRMRVWERGTGITQACGSGACATLVAARLNGLTGRDVKMELDGGWMALRWRQEGVWMTGATAHVFDAMLSPALLAQASDPTGLEL